MCQGTRPSSTTHTILLAAQVWDEEDAAVVKFVSSSNRQHTPRLLTSKLTPFSQRTAAFCSASSERS